MSSKAEWKYMNDTYQDFYPTPIGLIEKMLSGASLNQVKSILEPSAGKGDICDYIKERTKYDNRSLQMDVVEIDSNLQHILKGKGYNLIHDDFLTLNTYKQYQLIVANFPFSEGAEHLQKALSLLETSGGSLVCLVNAETIRNQHTKLRQAVASKLEGYGASIEYLTEEFVEAERKTSVDVALIKVQVERATTESVLLDNLKRAEAIETVEQEYAGLVEVNFSTAMVKRFDLECWVGIRLIEEYEALKPLMLKTLTKPGESNTYNSPIIELKVGGASEYRNDYVNEYVRSVRHKYWSVLIADERFRKVYTSNVLKELSEKLEALRDCDFSEFNIQQLQADLNRNLSSGIEKAIMDMFDEFSSKYAYRDEFGNNIHYYNGWKTNQAYKINKKVIVPMNGFASHPWKDRDELSGSYIRERIGDLVKAFNYLAGEIDNAQQLVVDQVENANSFQTFRNVDFHYFTATFFKKGTCHIQFKDLKLLDKLNIYGSQRKGWLPPSYGKKSYTAMNEEERQVVDEFQGEEAYNEVVSNSDYYLAEPIQLMLEA